MKGIVVSAIAETASFRDPGAQLYHSCLPLPSFTTLVGLAGAALGMDFEKALTIFRNNRILVGVHGNSEGAGRDLWNYSKVVSRSEVRKDIVNREFLVKLSVCLFYAIESGELLYKLRKAFLDPSYCLSLGNSDDLLMIKSVSQCLNVEVVKSKEVANTIVCGDISEIYEFDWDTIKKSALNINLGTPEVKNLPVDYTFSHQLRKGSRYETFSFIPELVRLKEEIKMYDFGNIAIPMFSL